jgi:hypothetical protein
MLSTKPLPSPCLLKASMAYCEQDGENRQTEPNSGEITS